MSEPRNTPPAPTRRAAPLAMLAPSHPALWGCVAVACNLAALALVIGGR